MAKEYVHTEIAGRKLKLSNLQKVLYPDSNVSKAEIIQYYLAISSYMLPFIAKRPLTLIRFPDGIDKGNFYTKTRPDWSPPWIGKQKIQHSEESIDYVVIKEEAGLVWLANLAALEIHPMQMTTDEMSKPDHFIFDLDPPENGDFNNVKQIALHLKDYLEDLGYHPFVKTSGSKGLHIFIPIIKEHDHETMVTHVKSITKIFVKKHASLCTLQLSKDKRDGKTLIDIFRNHESHTTVAAFSLRGKKGASISFPIPWEYVLELEHSKQIHIGNYQEYLDSFGNAWKDFYVSASHLFPKIEQKEELSQQTKDKLASYISKRDLEATPEPGLSRLKTSGKEYCIQLHDASNLHYDLRLEEEGTLKSWAIPKGMPLRLGQKRLAIQTEDHPIKYLDFEGNIPKGQYGAGNMWLFERGQYELHKKKEGAYTFSLNYGGSLLKYSIYNTKADHWIIELKNEEEILHSPKTYKPMLADSSKKIPTGDYLFEVKWDGIRCIIELNEGKINIFSKSGRDITDRFPEFQNEHLFEIEQGVFDGEIVCLDGQGRPMFSQVISRMHSSGEKSVNKARQKYPAVCYLFDMIVIDGKNIATLPLIRRQAWLKTAIKTNASIRISEAIRDGKQLYEAAKTMELEGIMAKKANSPYMEGQRSNHWLKIKFRSIADCYIAGYTKGEGDRANLFGALHLLIKEEGQFKYMGKVGTGFDSTKMKMLLDKFQTLLLDKKPFKETTDDDKTSTWLQPDLLCEVQYASLSSNGTYREPVFIRLKEKL